MAPGQASNWRDALLNHAKLANPDTELPSDVYIAHDADTVTVQDKFPKSTYHWLCLPRLPFSIQGEGSATINVPQSSLANLRALADTKHALPVLKRLKESSEKIKEMMLVEMQESHRTTWDIQCGFHSNESMNHIHLHIVSVDFCSDRLKHKKHYNSFHPSHGFFLHFDDVLRRAEEGLLAPSSPFDRRQLQRLPDPRQADKLLTAPLVSFRNGETYNTIPQLQQHLRDAQEEDLSSRRKRKAPQTDAGEASSKKRHMS